MSKSMKRSGHSAAHNVKTLGDQDNHVSLPENSELLLDVENRNAANDGIHTMPHSPDQGPRSDRFSRVFFDMASASLLIALLSPYLLYLALISRIRTGRVFNVYPKIGKNGKVFNIHKFSCECGGRNLAMLLDIARNKISWVGPSIKPYKTPTNKAYLADVKTIPLLRPGVVSLYSLRRELGTLYEKEPMDSEYPNHSLINSFTVIARSIVANALSSKLGGDNRKEFTLFGIRIDNITVKQAVDYIIDHAEKRKKFTVAFVNPACANEAVVNPQYLVDLNNMDRVFPDGSGLSLACKMLGIQMKANINGTDLFPNICENAVKKGLSIYLLGARPGVAETMAEKVSIMFPGLTIAGHHHGYFNESEEPSVIENINASGADILMVAFGVPSQERWIQTNASELQPSVIMGVGGLFDFYSGRISRSPRWLQDMGMEWVWRFLQEPSRMWKRYFLGNPLFVYRVWRQRQSCKRLIVTNRFLKVQSVFTLGRIRFKLKHVTWKLVVGSTHAVKRIMDIAVAGMAIFMLIPALLILAVVLKSESRGPLFYSQIRVGRWGKLFKMYKFRSMYIDADQRKQELASTNEMKGGVIFKMKNDPRVTKVGRFIRKYSIDELPQFWNVLIGDMSLVGPRPPLPSEVAQYSMEDRRRLEVKPGITCIWQVSGRSEIPFKEQVQLDVKYIESNGLWADIKILFATIPAVLLGKGAY